MTTPTPNANAENFLNEPHFNRTFTLPADPSRGRSNPFTIKYVDHGYRNEAHPEQEHVLLYSPPLVGSRLLLVTKDDLAIRHKIRIIAADRPGMGGTDAAAPKDRIALWTEAMAALLDHLSIPHISLLATHSGGTPYALDFLLHHPTLLAPSPSPGTTTPPTTLAIGAPWILPIHTGSAPLALAKMLPPSVVAHTDKLVRLVGNWLAPAIGGSAGSVAQSMPVVLGSLGWGRRDPAEEEEEEDVEDGAAKREEGMRAEIMKRVYEEGVKGVSEDALMLLQEGEGMEGGWGDWGDYDALVPRLAEVLKNAGRRLRVEVFYAEKDFLIGNGGSTSKGGKWLDGCWEGTGEEVEYRSRVVAGADHDRVWDLRFGAIQELFKMVGGSEGEVGERGALS